MPAGSPYRTVSLDLSGPSYESRSIPLSAQRSFNMYPDATSGGISPVVMHSWMGLQLRSSNFSSDPIIGCYVFKGSLYAVSGVTLRKYSYDLTSYTEVGDIDAAASTRAIFSDNGQVMVIVAGASAWQYDGVALSKIPGVTFKPTKVQFLNERFYLNGDDGGISVSDVLSTNFDSANVFYGRSTPEQTVSHYIFNQIIYLFDSSSIEPWGDAATGAPPANRINQGIIEGVGCSSIYGIASSEKYMYFIGSDGHAYRVNGFASQEITNPVIARHFRSLNNQRCEVDFLDMNGHKFIMYHFVDDRECWVFSESSSQWFEVGNDKTPDGEGVLYQPVCPVFYDGSWVCGDRNSGSIFEFVTDFVLNGTIGFTKERVIATLSGDDIGKPGTKLEMSKLRISMETGTSNPFFSKQPPEIAIIPSFDGGYTFGRPIVLDIGRTGDYTKQIEVHQMQQFDRAVFKIRMTDFLGNVGQSSAGSLTLFSASIDIRQVPY